MLDEEGNEIELKDEDDDLDVIYTDDRAVGVATEQDYENSGFRTGDNGTEDDDVTGYASEEAEADDYEE